MLTNDKTIFDRALIYHDSSAVAYFGDQLSDVDSMLFCGNEYRANEILSAIMREQFKRMDGILKDLRANKKYLMDALADVCEFAPSNDIEGDCGTTLPISFESYESACAFAAAEGINGSVPYDTGKHVYKNWTPIMTKTGALNPLMDPFKMEANKDIVPDYSEDMCPKTLDILSKTAYININPDWTKAELDKMVENVKKALNK